MEYRIGRIYCIILERRVECILRSLEVYARSTSVKDAQLLGRRGHDGMILLLCLVRAACSDSSEP